MVYVTIQKGVSSPVRSNPPSGRVACVQGAHSEFEPGSRVSSVVVVHHLDAPLFGPFCYLILVLVDFLVSVLVCFLALLVWLYLVK